MIFVRKVGRIAIKVLCKRKEGKGWGALNDVFHKYQIQNDLKSYKLKHVHGPTNDHTLFIENIPFNI